MTLDPEDIEAIAARVASLVIAEIRPAGDRYVDATTLAKHLGVDRDWVYAHATELGALRLGGAHGRLRFDLDQAIAALHPHRPARARRQVPRRRSHRREASGLIPYDG
ncbi:MAG TPA: hypothetical protein VMF57_06085 [Solirubrobacteraceae bacterium]|nr:hypothetical protein [Solirubrobacteraceae bacterium]